MKNVPTANEMIEVYRSLGKGAATKGLKTFQRLAKLIPHSLEVHKGLPIELCLEIDRSKVGSFVTGYVKTGVKYANIDTDKFGIYAITELSLMNIIRSCAGFCYINNSFLEAAYQTVPDYSEFRAGKDFWVSRNERTKKGFTRHAKYGPSTARILHESARSFTQGHMQQTGFEIEFVEEGQDDFQFDFEDEFTFDFI